MVDCVIEFRDSIELENGAVIEFTRPAFVRDLFDFDRIVLGEHSDTVKVDALLDWLDRFCALSRAELIASAGEYLFHLGQAVAQSAGMHKPTLLLVAADLVKSYRAQDYEPPPVCSCLGCSPDIESDDFSLCELPPKKVSLWRGWMFLAENPHYMDAPIELYELALASAQAKILGESAIHQRQEQERQDRKNYEDSARAHGHDWFN